MIFNFFPKLVLGSVRDAELSRSDQKEPDKFPLASGVGLIKDSLQMRPGGIERDVQFFSRLL